MPMAMTSRKAPPAHSAQATKERHPGSLPSLRRHLARAVLAEVVEAEAVLDESDATALLAWCTDRPAQTMIHTRRVSHCSRGVAAATPLCPN